MRVDPDGRMRSSYGPYADTGRLRSSESPRGTGTNAQNIDHEARDIYIPDEGCIMFSADLSQAESRDVWVRTGDAGLIERARLLPGEGEDPHTKAASIAFRKTMADVKKFPDRYVGKRARHGGNYGMGGANLADQLLKEGLTFTGDECQRMMDDIIDRDTPAVRDWQRNIRQQIMRNHGLTNSWGRSISYRWERMDEHLYSRAYAFLPQSDVGDLMNQWGLIPMAKYIRDNAAMWERTGRPRPAINLHGHDSLLISVHPLDAWTLARMFQMNIERPRVYDGGPAGDVELTLWSTFTLAPSYADGVGVEYERLPAYGEFTERAVAIGEAMWNQQIK